MDGIFIKRDDGRSIYACYLKETENIKKGMSIMVFPEGTRVVGDEFKEFKPTVLKVAYENFISICPLVLYGTDKKRKLFNKKIVRITSLKPIQPNNFITTKKEPMMASLQDKVIDKYNELKKSIEEKSK
ncbi:MAG: 1-acyl-sn-glycerol-3-phosphate acyltransferase [Mycoplasmoidaceae bacterium]|nr:1-acyl-sn-glycerol-3-phosphate acyltransferase [Mycoplasmoidaceae bacterium]